MRIFITGACGFIGSHLIEALLKAGHEVYGNDNLSCGDAGNTDSKYWTNLDCCDFDGMLKILRDLKPDVVVHTAALAHEGLSNFSPNYITKSIYQASVSVFSASISAGVHRIVNMSSMARYGNNKLPFTEDMQPVPVDAYGIAKLAAENTLRSLCDLHGVKWSILVPHNVLGIKQRHIDPARNVASIMINRCKQGKPPIIYGDGMQTRCFSPVADCLPSIVKAVNGAADGEIVNIGPDSGEITIKELAEKIIALTGFKGEPIYMPDRPNEVKHAYCSSDKARKLLGYEPKQSIDDCLAEMVAAIEPKLFVYDFPLEIVSDKTPKTWTERTM